MATIVPTPAAAGAPAAYDGFDCMLLNGRWRHGGSGQSMEDVDPYSNDVLLRIPLADQADLDDASKRRPRRNQRGRAHGLQRGRPC